MNMNTEKFLLDTVSLWHCLTANVSRYPCSMIDDTGVTHSPSAIQVYSDAPVLSPTIQCDSLLISCQSTKPGEAP